MRARSARNAQVKIHDKDHHRNLFIFKNANNAFTPPKKRYNETLIPTDSKFSGVIVDDDINKLMINKLPRGATLNCLIDACHSGTVMDLQFVAGLAAPGHPWMWVRTLECRI